jgi:hypothetical protein
MRSNWLRLKVFAPRPLPCALYAVSLFRTPRSPALLLSSLVSVAVGY